MGVKWIYDLNKRELIQELDTYNIDSSGTVVQLRQRLVAFVKSNPEIFDKPEDPEDYKEEEDISRDLIALEDPNLLQQQQPQQHQQLGGIASTSSQGDNLVFPIRTSTPSSGVNDTFVLDTMRKWSCSFDGRDPYAFLERVEELQTAYGFTDQQLLRGFPELLRGDALLWYRNEISTTHSLEQLTTSLRKFYLSPGELRNLESQISNRVQSKNDPIRNYANTLRTLMRRHGGYDATRQLDTLYWNMQAIYRLHIRRTEVDSVSTLIQRVEEVAEILNTMKKEEKPENPGTDVAVAEVSKPYDPKTHCWRCGKFGHRRTVCRSRPKKFCSYCGTENIFTRDCKCHPSGNGKKVEPKE